MVFFKFLLKDSSSLASPGNLKQKLKISDVRYIHKCAHSLLCINMINEEKGVGSGEVY